MSTAETSEARRTPLSGGARPAIVVAAVGSAVAGLVHAAAAGTHQGDSLLVWMFSACAAAQLGWGWAVAVTPRPRRSLLLTGLVINAGAVLVWAWSRTIGISFINSLKVPEEVGTQDLTCALFAALSVAAIVCLLVRPKVRVAYPPTWAGAIAVGAFLLAMPALAAGHTHPAGAHDHVLTGDAAAASHNHSNSDTATDNHDHTDAAGADAGGGHDHGVTTDATSVSEHDHGATTSVTTPDAHDHAALDDATSPVAHDHSDAAAAPATHDHSSDSGTTDTSAPHNHDPGTTPGTTPPGHNHDPGTTIPGTPPPPEPPITSLDDPRLTPEQVQAAINLIVATINGLPASLTEADVLAAGYQSLGDGTQPGQYEHFVNWGYVGDAFELDAGHIESIVMKINADGTKRVVAAMYSLSWGKTLADAPDIAGGLTIWHDHDNMCFVGDQFVGLTIAGVCPAGTLRDTPPMLDVWIEDNPCGPFAIIDNSLPAQNCGDPHSHH